MKHLSHSTQPGTTLCGESIARPGAGNVALLDEPFDCEACRAALLRIASKFYHPEWGPIQAIAHKRGFDLVFAWSSEGGLTTCHEASYKDTTLYSGNDGIDAANKSVARLVGLVRTNARDRVSCVSSLDPHASFRAIEDARDSLSILERAIWLSIDLRAHQRAMPAPGQPAIDKS